MSNSTWATTLGLVLRLVMNGLETLGKERQRFDSKLA